MIAVRRLIDWLNSLVWKWMSWCGPRNTDAKETEEVLRRKREYEQWAQEGK